MKCNEICPIAVPPVGAPEREKYKDKVTVGKVIGLKYQPISLDVGDDRVTVYHNIWRGGVISYVPPSAEPRCELPGALQRKEHGSVMVWGCPYISQNLVSFKVESL
jgi:hypothetical protein